MPKQSKFLLNIVCGTDNATGEIRGKIQCISSGQISTFTNSKELHDFLLREIHSMTEEIEPGQIEKGETSVLANLDQYPVIDYSKEL